MVASGVGQYSINVKSNLKDFYGSLTKAQRTLKELTEKKNQLQIDSSQLDKLRDKGQRIAAEMRELRQQKNEIKLGTKEVDNVDAALKNIDKKISSLNRQKLEVEAEIQPIRTANTQLYKVEQEIDRINNQKVDIKFSDSVKNIGSNIQNLGDGILKTFNPLTSKLNQMFGFGLITKGIDTVTSMVNNSVDSAIKRVDTLNNYTKVMSNLGVNEKDANSSKATLVKGLQGLPTALDDGVSAVQRFTSVNSDVNKSTKMFLALNNALLAGGAGAEIQSSALEQLSQSYSKGKPDITEFRSMQTAMPGQLKQVAKAMGMTTAELQQAMTGKNATVSMEQFLNKVVELNEKGSDGFKSFAEQAKNATGGVQTGIANMRTAVTRGVANIITSLDTMLQKANLGGISGVMSKIGSTIEKGLTSVGTAIENNKGTIINFISSLEKNFSKAFAVIQKFDFGAFFDGLGKGLNGLKNDGKSIINFIKPLFEILGKVAGDKNTPETLGKLIPRLFELGIALKAIGTATKVSGSVGGFLGKLTGLKLPKLPSFGGKAQEGELPLKNIGINDLKSLGMKMLTLAGLSANIFLAAKAIEEVNKIGNLRNLQPKLLAIAEAVVGMGVLATAAGFIAEKKPDLLISGLFIVAGIAGDIYLAAKALEEVSKVEDFKSITPKLLSIAEAVTGMGILATAVGAFIDTGFGAAALVSGLVGIAGIAGVLWLTSWELSKVQNIELDSKKIETNISIIKNAIESLAGDNILQTLTESVKGVAAIIQGIIDAGLIGVYIGLGNELKLLENIKLNGKGINNSIRTINSAIETITGSGKNESIWSYLGSMGKTMLKSASSATKTLQGIVDSALVATYLLLGNEMKKIQDLGLDKKAIASSVKSIKDSVSEITEIKFDETIASSWVKGKVAENIAKVNAAIQKIGRELKKIQNLGLDYSDIKTNVDNIRDGVMEIASVTFDDGLIDGAIKRLKAVNIGKLTEILEKIGQELKDIQNLGLDYADMTTSISAIQDGIIDISKIDFGDSNSKSNFANFVNSKVDQAKAMDKLIPVLQKIAKSLKDIQDVGQNINVDTLGKSIEAINTGISKLSEITFKDKDGKTLLTYTGDKNGITNESIAAKSMDTLVGTLKAIGDGLLKLQNVTIDSKKLGDTVNAINVGLDEVAKIDFKTDKGSPLFTFDSKQEGVTQQSQALDKFISELNDNLVPKLLAFQDIKDKINTESIQNVANSINKAIGILGSIKFGDDSGEQGKGGYEIAAAALKLPDFKSDNGKAADFELFVTSLNKLGETLKATQELGLDEGKLTPQLAAIKDAVNTLKGINSKELSGELTGLSTALDEMIKNISTTFPPKFKNLGQILAKQINEGFRSKLDLQTALKSKIDSLSTSGASAVGSRIAKAINDSLKNNLNIGESIHNSIVKALSENYSTKINVDLMTNKVDNSNSNSSSTKYPTVVMASGGRVATDSQLQDSPEKPLLGNGEYVIPAKIVKALGTPFFDKLRSGQISRTFAGLAQSVSNTTSSVVNNIYNNQTTNQHMTVYPSGHQDMMMISNRRVRV